ncbi:glycine oxidase ThiO [Acidihalobacter yilgarnensis]|uniref:Glycine oxidase ThiO n=1 Tax=Acidihalobacter yilgarnensis TaxID=2819280 RepID=A0A1D8ISI9_9GAMM|nr:glycine oxidase ThiO [Acidihalobacter yilgarnensis]AOU99480.1 glycine oxidase ThiO [Acidihalobacter yilgarnensis]
MDDCIIVGGGLIGMLAARELSATGLAVRLIERGELGHEASWAGGGILSPLYPWRYPAAVTRLARYGQARYPALARCLYEESGVDPEWEPSGLLVPSASEYDAARAWAEQQHVELEHLDADGMRRCEPALAPMGEGGLWLPGIAQMRNPRLVRALRVGLAGSRVVVETGNPVQGLRVNAGRICGVDTARGPRAAGQVVVAGGAWSAGLLAALGPPPPIRPVRGQMVVFRAMPGQLQRIVLHGDRYLIPRRDGRIVVGSTLEEVGFDKSTTGEACTSLTQAACALMPALSDLAVEHQWSGLRPGSPEGIPVVAEHPRVRGLFINAGHYRNGVIMGLGSVRVMVDLMLARPPVIDPTPYDYPVM